ncbi:MAG: DUF6702 family protein [Gemmatimonadales bacterium]
MITLHRVLGVAGLLLTPVVHPLHTTHTDMREHRGEIEITVRAFTDDLHRAVAAREHAADDSALVRYVRATLTLADPAGRPATLALVGTRIDGDITLVTLRAALPHGLAGARVRQAMHMELFEDQVNVVRIEYGEHRTSLLFTPGGSARSLP